nr:TetR family transcriptional regulator [Actinospica acidiphila]
MAATETLTAERILQATEEVLRRHGPAKATVVDVARALGVSHGSVYRHFRTKAALREAVTKRWLDRTSEALDGIAGDGSRDPETRLRDWLAALFTAKRRKAGDDPELFATYSVLAGEQVGAVAEHIDELTEQVTRIVADGVAAGVFHSEDPAVSARAVFQATGRFHDPAYAGSGTGARRTRTSRRRWICCCGGCGPDTSAAPGAGRRWLIAQFPAPLKGAPSCGQSCRWGDGGTSRSSKAESGGGWAQRHLCSAGCGSSVAGRAVPRAPERALPPPRWRGLWGTPRAWVLRTATC